MGGAETTLVKQLYFSLWFSFMRWELL